MPPSYRAMKCNQSHWVQGVSVIIATYSIQRWESLCETVKSVLSQTVPVYEIIVAVDNNSELYARANRELSGVTVISHEGPRGAAASRNAGVAVCHSDTVAFLDDDTIASPDWLASLLPHFSDQHVIGAGPCISPLWTLAERPCWLPLEFDWIVGTSYQGMPEVAAPVRNLWSNGMTIRRHAFEVVGGFRDEFGKTGRWSQPEDTDLCLRVTAAFRHGSWIYEPRSLVEHRVPASRSTWQFFAWRCFNEGLGKAKLATANGFSDTTSEERRYACRVLPIGILKGIVQGASGDIGGFLRSMTTAAGLCIALCGFITGKLKIFAHAGWTRVARDRPSARGTGRPTPSV